MKKYKLELSKSEIDFLSTALVWMVDDALKGKKTILDEYNALKRIEKKIMKIYPDYKETKIEYNDWLKEELKKEALAKKRKKIRGK